MYLLEFRRDVEYLGLSTPRKSSCRKLSVLQVNDDFLKVKNEHVIVKNPEDSSLQNAQQNQDLSVKNQTLDDA